MQTRICGVSSASASITAMWSMASLCGAGISSGMSVSVVRCFRRSSSVQVFATIRHSQLRNAAISRSVPRFCHARSSASCTASSQSLSLRSIA